MYRCAPCDINYSSTRKLYSHQLTPEHSKRMRSINNNHAHSSPRQLSKRNAGKVGVGRAGDGLEVRGGVGSTAVSVNQSGRTTSNQSTYGTKAAGFSTSMNVNRTTRPQQGPNQVTGSRVSNIISQPNLRTLTNGAKGDMRKNTGSSGVRGGRVFGRRASVVSSNSRRTTGTHLINQSAAPEGPQLGTLQYRRTSTASRKPVQKVLRTVRQRNKRAKSIQRQIEPGGLDTAPQGTKRHKPISLDRGSSEVMKRKEATKSFNKQRQKPKTISGSKASKEVSPSVASTFNLSKVEMNMKYIQKEKVEPPQQNKLCDARKHLLLPPKKTLPSVAPIKVDGGGKVVRTPPKKNVERYNRFISNQSSLIRAEGISSYQPPGKAIVPSTSSSLGTNMKSVAAVATVSGPGQGRYVVPNAALPYKLKAGTFKAAPYNTNHNSANGFNPTKRFLTSSDKATKPVPVVVVPTASSANRSSKNSTASAAKIAARRGGRLVSKSSIIPAPFKARVVSEPGKALAQKKNGKPSGRFQTIQPSGKKGKGAQGSSQKGKPTKIPPQAPVQSSLSGPANVPGKKRGAAAIASAAHSRVVVAKAISERRQSAKRRGVEEKLPPQKKNGKLANRFNTIQASSTKDGVAHSPKVQSTKRSPGGVASWLSATDRGGKGIVKKSTLAAKQIAQPKVTKVRKRVKRVTLKLLKNYIPTMPGTNYKMPLQTALASYTNKEGKKLWICLVCNKTEPMKSSKPMVCCEICNDWYHFKCVGIKKPMPKKDPWYCKRCVYRASEKKRKI